MSYQYDTKTTVNKSDGTSETLDAVTTIPDEAIAARVDEAKQIADATSQTRIDEMTKAMLAVLPDQSKANIAAMIAGMTAGLNVATPPVAILPPAAGVMSDLAVMPDESVLSVGPNGEIYLDGVRLGTARGSKMVKVGKSIYVHGATDGNWYKWVGSSWVVIPTANVDPMILQA